MTEVVARIGGIETLVVVEWVGGDVALVHDIDGRNSREIDKMMIADAWECDCVLPEQSCPGCLDAAGQEEPEPEIDRTPPEHYKMNGVYSHRGAQIADGCGVEVDCE